MIFIFSIVYFESKCMEYFLFSLFLRKKEKKTPPKDYKVVFCLFFTLGGLFFQGFIGFIREKNP